MFSIKYEWIRQPLFNGHILEVSNLPVRISTIVCFVAAFQIQNLSSLVTLTLKHKNSMKIHYKLARF